MIVTRTPLRMSFVGGGSDLPSFYKEHGGAVISSTIDSYVYLIIKKRFEEGIRVSYSKTENVSSLESIEHPLVRNALKLKDIRQNLEIISVADIPSSGTGLGSSSSFSVGLIKGLNILENIKINKSDLAETACKLEIDICKSPIGKQDQYAASFGGLRVYKFNSDETVDVEKLKISNDLKLKLNDEILSFYIGGSRNTNKILSNQQSELKKTKKINLMKKMVKLVDNLKDEFLSDSLENFGNILHENWILKKQISNQISSNIVDDLYNAAISCGATGGKLLGAGGSGFMIFHAPNEKIKFNLRKKFEKLREVNFNLENSGSKEIKIN